MIRPFFLLYAALSVPLCARLCALYFQLESYQLGGYFRSLRRSALRAFLPGIAVSAASSVLISLMTRITFEDWLMTVGLSLSLAMALLAYLVQSRLPAKKPLVFTPRVKRLAASLALVSLLFAALLSYGFGALSLVLLLPLFTPLLLLPAALLALPLEKLIQRLYLRDAMKRLDAMEDLIKIGITGSYGKTSTKFMLETLLSEKYRVLVTPGSFNTSMGVTRIVRERLLPDHQVFIAEMGARHRGDIRLLCRLVRPKYGILTSVGPQHLETFRSQENILREKFELALAIPPDGAMVFGSDGGLNDGLYAKATCPKHLAGRRAEGLGLTAGDVEVGPWGSRFTLSDGEKEIRCETRLLGAHNIDNLLTACTLARVLGMDLETIGRGIAKVKPVEHRLQLLSSPGGVTVIDDAFNANPVGAKMALDVLQSFPGRRIVVTPGFVELGAQEARYNREFGEQMAQSADLAILVGKDHTAPVAAGLRAKGFDEKSLHVVASLAESSALLSTLMRPGDVVLYENDLPDNYQG